MAPADARARSALDMALASADPAVREAAQVRSP
jgi:hypothetical protein